MQKTILVEVEYTVMFHCNAMLIFFIFLNKPAIFLNSNTFIFSLIILNISCVPFSRKVEL